jgi:hypothetical protein
MRAFLIRTSFAVLLGGTTLPTVAAELPEFVGRISAGTIAAISDGDFVSQSYVTGRLAPRERHYRDLLTVLSIVNGKITTGTLPVSNSVTAAPEILELSRDGLTAFVTERLGERPTGGETVRDLPPGRRLFAIDLTNKTTPRIADIAEIAAFPESLSISPDGTRVAVVSNTPEASFVQIVSYAGGRFGPVARFDLADLGITGTAQGPRGGVTATNVHWHPSGRFIAVNINTQNRVAFFQVKASTLEPWGNPVMVGVDPFVGRFTPDGRYYLTSDWGRNFAATNIEARLPETPSSISVVRLADVDAAGVAAQHRRIGGAATDFSAEGIAVSPDGRLVATINMRGTPFLPNSPRFQREASVTLLTFDPATGALAKTADYPFEGVLPEGGVFDLTGDHLLVAVFQGHEDADVGTGAGVDVFRVRKDERPTLERLGRIPLPHGTHHVDVAR